MSIKLTLGFASILSILALSALPAQAQIEVTNRGENFSVSRDPADDGNIVGGGTVVAIGRGENLSLSYQDPQFAERGPGIPYQVGGGNGDVVYLPPGLSARQLSMLN
ncbi:hypothetical protein [Teichococcus vastitatis]|jgi:hypothetical protein|uniref:Uncharacterized protein n=1 Tax=Teichococcus vastitatis TaxID=2307076 RepID=A0ABS9W7Z7_9PROT|nr:hypothetical protein [Pseudoroseomonas vastitatis]MCI0754719.1 hypothetical protein [Pseudoroseomonas vastitatis]